MILLNIITRKKASDVYSFNRFRTDIEGVGVFSKVLSFSYPRCWNNKIRRFNDGVGLQAKQACSKNKPVSL